MRRGSQVPEEGEGEDTVTRVDREAETELERTVDEGRAVELERRVDDATELGAAELERTVELERIAELDGTAELERTAELDGRAELTTELTPEEPPQPNAMLLSCHVAEVEEKPDQTKPVMALALAPLN